MNMISTGAFLPEMDASNKQETMAEKFARVWEKKNSKVARAGGVSLMALSLAACGSSSTTTPAATPTPTPTPDPEPTTPVTPAPTGQTFTLTTSTDISGVLEGSAGTTDSTGDDTYTVAAGTLAAADVIADSSGTDVMNIAATANTPAATIVGVETINANFTMFAEPTFVATNVTNGAVTINQLEAGASTNATVTNLGALTSVTAGTGITGTLTVSAAGNGTINGGSAATINVTGVVDTGITIVSGDSTNNIGLEDDNNSDADDVATISAAGTVVLDPETQNGRVVEVLNLSGNGAAVTYDITSANTAANTLETVTLSGDQDITIIAASAALAGLDAATDFVDNTTAGTVKVTADVVATGDLTHVKADILDINAATGGATTLTIANNQVVEISADVDSGNNAALALQSTELTSGDETVNLNLEITQTRNGISVTDFEVVNLHVDDASAATTTAQDITVSALVGGASTDINVTGDLDNLILTTVTADNIVATNFAGDLTVSTNANVDNVTGGAGDDEFTVDTNDAAAGASTTFSGGAGADTMTVAAGTTTQAIIFNGGDGTDTLDVSTASIATDRFTLTDVEVVNFRVDSALDARDINGATWNVTGDDIDVAETITIDMTNTTSVDLSKLTIDTTAGGVDISVANTTALASTIIGSNGVDVIAGGTAADNITGGNGADTITSGTGADTIDLTETTAATDTIVSTVGTAYTAAAADTIIGFALGATNGDNFDINWDDLDPMAAGAGIANHWDDGDTLANAGAASIITEVGEAFDLGADATADTNILALTGASFADGDAVTVALEDGGSHELTNGGAWTADDIGMILYTDGTDGYLAVVASAAGAANDATFAADDLTVTNIATFSGITDWSDVVVGNFDIIT